MLRTLRSFRTFTCRCVFHTVVFTTLTSVKESEHILFRILVFHINHVWFISRPLRGSRDKQDEKLYKVTTPLWGFITLEIHNLKERKRVLLLFHQRLSVMSLKTSDLCEGMLDVVAAAAAGVEHLSGVAETEERHGVWFVKCGTTPVVLSGQHGGHLAAVLRSPSSFWSSELCSIEALPAHSHANTGEGSSRCETFGSLLVHL